MTMEIFSMGLTAIATAGLVVIGFMQHKIQKTQTDIQNKAIKTSLLEQRLNCLYNINSMRYHFLISSDLSNQIGFYNTACGAYGLADVVKAEDAVLISFLRAVEGSRYLFSKEHYNYLFPLVSEIRLLLTEHKKIYFNLRYIQALAEDGDKEAIKKLKTIESLFKNVANGSNIPEKQVVELMGIDYERYRERQNKVIEKFSNNEFFKTFDEYLDIK